MATGGWRLWQVPADDERCPSGIAVAVGAEAVVGVAVLAAVFARRPGLRLGLLMVAVAVFAAVARDGGAALAVAGLAWPVGNGFLVNQRGELSWHGRLDAWFVIGLLAAVPVGMATAQVRQELRSRRRWSPFAALPSEPVERACAACVGVRGPLDGRPGGAHGACRGKGKIGVGRGVRAVDGGVVRRAGGGGAGGGAAVTVENVVGLVFAVGLTASLVVALLFPERF